MFTKKDLKNGDVIVRRNGFVEIALADLGMFIEIDGWNDFDELREDLTDKDDCDVYDIIKVYRPVSKAHCSFQEYCYKKGTLVYDRNKENKRLYNGKVVCVDLRGVNAHLYTVGKIYQFKDGNLIADNGEKFPDDNIIHSFEDWANWTSSKFIEIKE